MARVLVSEEDAWARVRQSIAQGRGEALNLPSCNMGCAASWTISVGLLTE